MAIATSAVPLHWLEDETLHSICARHVLLAGRHSLRQTVKALFNTKLGKIACHFQGHLDAFVLGTNGSLGSAEEIIFKHTVIPNFLSFMTETGAELLVRALRVPKPYQTADSFLRDRAHPYPKQRHLRLCKDCVIEDEKARGFAHWRRSHQLPAVYRCPAHGTALDQLWVKGALHGTIVQMPQSDSLYREQLTAPVPMQDGEREIAMVRMAQIAVGIADMPSPTRFDCDTLHGTYRARLKDLGLMVADRVLRTTADAALLGFGGAMDELPEAPGWLSVSVRRAGLITRMASPSPPFARPLLHTVFIAWLFGSWQEFLAAYALQGVEAQAGTGSIGTGKSSKTKPESPLNPRVVELAARKAEVLALLRSGLTAHTASKRTGTPAVTGRNWAAAAGMGQPHWAGAVPLEMRSELKRLLKAGADLAVIASDFGITPHALNNFRSFFPAIEEARQQALSTEHQARVMRQLALARESWIEALDRSRRGDIGSTRLVTKDGQYFRKHDRAGYEAMLAANPPTSRANRQLPDLTERDGPLADAVQEAASAFRAENPYRMIHTWDIVRILEARGLLAKDCERLLMPLAKAALKQAVKTPPIAGDGR